MVITKSETGEKDFFDYAGFTHDGSGYLTTIVMKTGGASGDTVITYDLTYTSGKIATITKTWG